MSSRVTNAVTASALHVVVWMVASRGVQMIFSASPASEAYSLLSAWWATLYLGAWLHIGWRAVPILCIVMIVLQFLSINLLAVSREAIPFSIAALPLLLWRCLAFASPIVVNGAVRIVVQRWRGSAKEQR
jgi:hypothetical protein